MADASERRKQRILGNSQKRLERLQRLKRVEHPDNQQQLETQSPSDISRDEVSPTTRLPGPVDAPQEISNASPIGKSSGEKDVDPTTASSPSDAQEESSESASHKDTEVTKSENTVRARKPLRASLTDDSDKPKSSQPTPAKETKENEKLHDLGNSSTPSESPVNQKEDLLAPGNNTTVFGWFLKKRRFIVFVLLSLLCYCLRYEGFDVFLASLTGRRNVWKSSDNFIKLFGAVELQMIVVDLFGGQQGSETQLPFMLRIVLNSLRVPKSVTELVSRLITIVSLVLTDFCVYFFIYVILVQLKSLTTKL